MSDQDSNHHSDVPAGESERFETVWDRTINGGVGGWVRRRVTPAPGADPPPPRPYHQPTAHLPTVPGPPGRTPGAFASEQETIDARATPLPPPGPPSRLPPAADWFQHERGPSPLPRGGTFADAAQTPAHGVPPTRDASAAPDWYRGGTPPPSGPPSPTPPGATFERTLLFVVVAVVFVAALGTLFALRPWDDDRDGPSARGSRSADATPDDSGPPGGSTTAGPQPGLPPATAPAQSTIPSPPPVTTTPPDGRAQAAQLDTLLAHSGSSRQSVIDAVDSVGSCTSLSASHTALLDAAAQRDDLVTRLDAMSFEGAPELQAAAPMLRTAWTASARADRAFAAWAESAIDSGCPGSTSPYEQGASISEEASAAKQSFVATWNGVAAQYGLSPRSELDL